MSEISPVLRDTPVLVIGNEGRFGSWIYRLLQRHGAEKLQGCDLHNADELEALAAESRIAIIAVSLPEAPKIARRLAAALPETGLIVDVSSFKVDVAATLGNASQDILLIHPMCAPPIGDSLGDAPLVIARDDTWPKHASNVPWLDEFLRALGGRQVFKSVGDHDLACHILQTATHAALLGLAEQIVDSGLTFRELREMAPPVGALVLDAIELHFGRGSPDVFAWLQKVPEKLPIFENPTAQLMLSVARTAQEAWNPSVSSLRWQKVARKLFPPQLD